jgi:hypothetical protein
VELCWGALDRGEHERRIGEPALVGRARGATGRLGHRVGDRVEAEDERVGPPASDLEDRPSVTGTDIDDEPSVRLGQSSELADVHLDAAASDDALHGRTV